MRIVDACAHPLLTSAATLREYLPGAVEPAGRARARAPRVRLASGGAGRGARRRGADPAVAARELLERRGISDVHPAAARRATCIPNHDLASAICAATNDWLARRLAVRERPLLGLHPHQPGDPEAAVRELERWADHPRSSRWRSRPSPASLRPAHVLPALGGGRPPRPAGRAAQRRRRRSRLRADDGRLPPRAIEFATLQPLNAVFHLASFIAEGVLERLPDLRIVLRRGRARRHDADLLALDKDYRGHARGDPVGEADAVALRLRPGPLLRAPGRPAAARRPAERWMEVTHARRRAHVREQLPARGTPPTRSSASGRDVRERILSGNARELYGLPAAAPA